MVLPAVLLAAGESEDLVALPDPPLERMESAVRKQLEEARASVDAALAAKDASAAERAEAMGILGRLYLGYGLSSAAEAALRNAQRLAPDDLRWVYYLATLYQHERRLDDAREELLRALELRPRDVPTLLRLGDVELARARADDAARAFNAALAIDGGSAAAHEGLARTAVARGDPASAVENYETALRLQPSARAMHYPLALAYRDLGRTDAMRAQLAQMGEGKVRFDDPLAEEVQGSVTGVGPHLAIGHIAMRAGDLDQAAERFAAALEVDPGSPQAHHAMAMVLERRGEPAQALAELDAAASLAPRDPEVLRAAAAGHLRAGNDWKAIELLRAAALVAPDFRTLLDLAMALERTGNLEEANERYRDAAAAEPRDMLPIIRRALVFQRMGATAEAAAELEVVVAAEPRNAEALLRLAQIRESRGETTAAIGHYRAMLALDLGAEVDRGVHAALGELLEPGDPEAAAAEYGEAVRLQPESPELSLRQARALLRANLDREARAVLEVGRESASEVSELSHLLARVLAASEDDAVRDGPRALELALAAFEQARDVDRAETVAMSLAEVGRFGEAAAWQRRIVEQVEAAGETPSPGLIARLESYQAGRPCRAPWRESSSGPALP
jgi:tetratricopeptide (TPR) repeat protein